MADFDAGSIESKLELDKDPFLLGLAEAQAEADAFADDPIKKKVEVDDSTDSTGNLLGITSRSILTGGTGIAVAIASFSPVIDVLAGAVLGLSDALSVAGAGLGAFGLSAFDNLSKITSAYDNINKAQQELADSRTPAQIKKATEDIADAEQGLTPPLKTALAAFNDMMDAYNKFGSDTAPKVLGVFDSLFNIAAEFIPKLTPIANATADALQATIGPIQNLLTGPAMTGFLALVKNEIGPVIGTLADDTVSFVGGLLQMFQKLQPLIAPSMGVLTGMVQGFVGAVNSPAFQIFIKTIESDIPMIAPLINSVFTGIGDIMVAVLPAAPGFMILLNGIVDFIDALATGGTLGALAQAVGALFTAITPILPPLAALVNAIATPALTLLADTFVALAPAVQQIADALAPEMPIIAQSFSQLLLALIPILPPLTQLTVLFVQELIPYLPLLNTLMGGFVDLVQTLVPLLMPLINDLVQAQEEVGGALEAIGRFLSDLAKDVDLTNIKKVFGDVKNAVVGAFDDAGTWLEGIGDKIIGGLVSGFHDVKNVLVGAFNGSTQWLLGVGESIIGGLYDGFRDLFPQGRSVVDSLKADIIGAFADARRWLNFLGGEIINGLWDGIRRIWTDVLNWFEDIPNLIIGTGKAQGGAQNWLVKTGEDIITGLWNGIKAVFTDLWRWWTTIPNELISVFKSSGTWLITNGYNMMTGLLTGITNGFVSVSRWLLTVGGQIISRFSGAQSWLLSAGASIISGLYQGAYTYFVGPFLSWLSGIASRIVSAVGNLYTDFLSVGASIPEGIWDGIRNGWDEVTGGLSGLISHLPGPVKKILGAASPSQVFADIGETIPQGLALGINRGMAGVHLALGKAPTSLPVGSNNKVAVASGPAVLIQNATFQDETDLTALMNKADFYIAQGRLSA